MNRLQASSVFAMMLALLLTGCIRSTSEQSKKWQPEKRAQAHVDLGMTYLRRNQLDTANSEFDMALSINPQSDTAHHARALLLARMGNNDEAMTFFAKSVALNPGNYRAANDYGIHLCQQNQVAKGIRRLTAIEGVAANDQGLSTNLGLGVCYFLGDHYDLAENYLRVVLAQSPRLPQALLPMAEISFSRNRYLSARGFLERYFGTGSLSERSLFLAFNVELKLGDKIKAGQYGRELRQRFPLSALNSQLDSLLK